MAEQQKEVLDLGRFLSSVGLETALGTPAAMLRKNLNEWSEEVSEQDRFLAAMAGVAQNIDPELGRFDKQSIQDLVAGIDSLIDAQLNEILHQPEFQRIESVWTQLADLVANTNFKANIKISMMDLSKDEAFEDLELNSADIAGSELFKKIYVSEYDQFGGEPFGSIIGLYEFANTPADRTWLRAMGKIASASHAPFVGAVAPQFFGCNSMAEVNQLRDLGGMMDTPKYSAWNQLRDSDEAAYLSLCMPRFIVRAPWNNETNPAPGVTAFTENVGPNDADYLWGNPAILFARNLVKSFESSGWCQYIRGVKGGGLIQGLPCHTYNVRGEDELKLPVEISIPDFRELELANSGFVPLIHKKGTAEAVFFSAQSIKKSHKFKDPKDSENSQLVTNMSYTMSVSRIAHYLKCIMRDNIGSSADRQYIFDQIDRWVSGYVTAMVNPDDLTLRYYPFKAYSLEVTEVPGRAGWYHCNLSILPHIQFEGMDVDLRVDARLG